MTKEIYLSNGGIVLVDDDAFAQLNEFNWFQSNGYAARMTKRPNGQRIVLFMHWCVKKAQPGFVVDHINGNRLDNRSENLRICTRAENNINRRNDKSNTSSKYKGVCWRKHANAWKAYIKKNGKQIHLGYFKDEMEAALAYNKEAVKLFGEFALLNKFEEAWA